MVKVVNYSEKSIALFGNTKPIKDEIKEIGGRFNRWLTNPETQDKEAGWIFSKRKEDKVLEMLTNAGVEYEQI